MDEGHEDQEEEEQALEDEVHRHPLADRSYQDLPDFEQLDQAHQVKKGEYAAVLESEDRFKENVERETGAQLLEEIRPQEVYCNFLDIYTRVRLTL